MSAFVCYSCGVRLFRSSINGMLRCLCKSGANVPQCYDENGSPYRVQERTPRQVPLSANSREDCGKVRQSKAHRLCIDERLAERRMA